MSKCESCANFVYQAITPIGLSGGRIFKGTPLEMEGSAVLYPYCGCIHSMKVWRRKSSIRKPNNMLCEYKEKVNA